MDIFAKHRQWNDVMKVCAKLRDEGYTAWLAGGCVRDGLMGIMPKDFDIATNARPKKIQSLFNKTVDVGKAFGVIRVVEPSGEVEVATFRKDGPYSDGRHPATVELSTPEEDAKRRDFTVNAMFYDPFAKKIHDFVGGEKDLKARVLRTVGIPADRFMEDRLRILRAVRFVSQLDFDLDETTAEAVKKFSGSVRGLSWERINEEFSKLFSGIRPDRGFDHLINTGLLDVLVPEFISKGDYVLFFTTSRKYEDRKILGWAYLFWCIARDRHDELFNTMRLSGEISSAITDICDLALSFQIFDRLSLADKKRNAADPHALQALHFNACLGNPDDEAENFVQKNRKLPPRFIVAEDLMALGVKPGKELGDLLEKAYEEQLEERVKSKGEALHWIKVTLHGVSAPA